MKQLDLSILALGFSVCFSFKTIIRSQHRFAQVAKYERAKLFNKSTWRYSDFKNCLNTSKPMSSKHNLLGSAVAIFFSPFQLTSV